MTSLFMWMVEDNGQPKCLIDGRPLATFYEDTALSPDVEARARRVAKGQPYKLVRFDDMKVVKTIEQTFAAIEQSAPSLSVAGEISAIFNLPATGIADGGSDGIPTEERSGQAA